MKIIRWILKTETKRAVWLSTTEVKEWECSKSNATFAHANPIKTGTESAFHFLETRATQIQIISRGIKMQEWSGADKESKIGGEGSDGELASAL